MIPESYEYDVALSFAGEDRDYVERVADWLSKNDVSVFYDNYEQVEMWGKDLYQHLHEVYSTKAEYCVIFVSEAYSRKIWTTHERRSAQERALRENKEYILPARFDDTELPGLPSTTAYIDLRNLNPQNFTDMIIRKLRPRQGKKTETKQKSFRMPQIQHREFNPYDEAERFISTLRLELQRRSEALRDSGASISIFEKGERTCFRIVSGGRALFSLDVWIGALTGDTGLSFYAIEGEIRASSGSINAWADVVWDKDREVVALDMHDLSLFSQLSGGEERMLIEEFIEKIWDRIVDVVEGEHT